MCRSLRENFHFGGNAMYHTLLEGNVAQRLLGVYTYYIYTFHISAEPHALGQRAVHCVCIEKDFLALRFALIFGNADLVVGAGIY